MKVLFKIFFRIIFIFGSAAGFIVILNALELLPEEYVGLVITAKLFLFLISAGSMILGFKSIEADASPEPSEIYRTGFAAGKKEGIAEGWKMAYENEALKAWKNFVKKEEQDNDGE